jgi:hypothetical protein
MLLPEEHLTWHDNVPIIVLERGERAPCDAFPNLTLAQCNGINDAWHSFQVDLSHRSKYAQLRVIPGAGHRLVMQKPEAGAQAIQDVMNDVDQPDAEIADEAAAYRQSSCAREAISLITLSNSVCFLIKISLKFRS